MTEPDGTDLVARARVDPEIFVLRPDYRAAVVTAEGLVPRAADGPGEALLAGAEIAAAAALGDRSVEDLAHVSAWRDAYRAFGAKPQRTRNSLEALLRRAPSGLPRVNGLTDLYNAISVIHRLPVGGEDLPSYVGPPRLRLATGREPFDTQADGAPAVEHPEPGEVVWVDDVGVTCRRWNWRQAHRTRLTADTTSALFILDALAPISDADLAAAVDDLVAHLLLLGPEVLVRHRVIARDDDPGLR